MVPEQHGTAPVAPGEYGGAAEYDRHGPGRGSAGPPRTSRRRGIRRRPRSTSQSTNSGQSGRIIK